MNSVPLSDILPWGFETPPCGGRTILVCDSNETDGRFLLHTIVSQCLSSKVSNPPNSHHDNATKSAPYHVIWVNCGTKTDAHLRASMKKIGCDIRFHEDLVKIIPTMPHFSQQYDAGESEAGKNLGNEDFLKGLYHKIKEMTQSTSKYTIIVDDCTLLSTFFGTALTFTFLHQIRSLIRKESKRKSNSLVILASNDLDQEFYINSTDQENRSVAGSKKLQYLGAGGRGMLHDSETMVGIELNARYEFDEIVWERALVELADGVVDVVPLSSGFAKDVHGRLVFTGRLGVSSWKDQEEISRTNKKFSTSAVNYCCSDSGIRAIRLRAESSK